MIIGNGQLAQAFLHFDREDVCYFASGVSNSNCIDPAQFDRERKLLQETLKKCNDKKFIYFSSCALSAPEYPKNAYYQHKQKMESLIKETSSDYYIFRIPQLFGYIKSHKTLINFLYESILEKKSFKVYNDAYRYVIEISDVVKLVNCYLEVGQSNTVLDIANPYRYKVLDIVEILEHSIGRQAIYEIINKKDSYFLNLEKAINFVKSNNINVHFSKDYLSDKLNKIILAGGHDEL